MERMLNTLRPVFIVGPSKSGTSFLLSLFDAHPGVVTLFETRLYAFAQRKRADGLGLMEALDAFFSPLFAKADQGFLNRHITRDELLAKVEKIVAPDSSEIDSKSLMYALLAVVFDNLEQASIGRVTHFVEKTPAHYRYVDRIFADFPTARIIHMLRDPRDNCLALRRRVLDPTSSRYSIPSYHAGNFIQGDILASLDAAYENVSRYGDRYRVLFYEDLIARGEPVVRSLAAWLDLEWNDSLLVPSVNGERWVGNSTAPDLRGQLGAFDTRPIGRWRGELSGREVDLMEHVIHLYRLQEKYPPSRAPSQLRFALALLPPFHGEVKRDFTGLRTSGFLPIQLAKVPWRYVKRRVSLYRHVWAKEREQTDNRLTESGTSLVVSGSHGC